MSVVLDFKTASSAVRRRTTDEGEGAASAKAEVVIFPGVRRQRHDDSADESGGQSREASIADGDKDQSR